MNAIAHSLYLALRHLRHFIRQPWWIAISLMQPIVWLLFYGQLFKRVVEIPGFNHTSYISFVTPGVIVMSALFAGGWNGMGILFEMDLGIMDRFLVSPVSRFALIAGRLIQMSVIIVIQSMILLVLGFLSGARFDGGVVGLAILILSAILLAVPFGALSNAMALVVRKRESVIGASNFILMPLMFLSPVFMASNLMPQWIRNVSRFNPVNWSVEAGREALALHPDWSLVGLRLLLLLGFTAFSIWLASRAFRTYQRTI